MMQPIDTTTAGWAPEAFAFASIDGIPERLIDRDVADLPWRHATSN
jgi:hypothetical protein